MEEARSTYPCKPFFQYKRTPYGFHYPCKKAVKKDFSVKPTVNKEEIPEATLEEVVVEEWKDVEEEKSYPLLKRQCSFPYFRSCRPYCRQRQKPSKFTSYWYRQFLNEWERPKEDLTCLNPPLKDSYEVLCGLPLCTPKPPVVIRKRGAFNPVHCVFCDKSLYKGGTIRDLHETVPAIKRQSDDRDDDIAYRIGLRTRVTVHKTCHDEYLKRPVTYHLRWEADECDAEADDCAVD